jgi:hypothetical protein
MVPMAESEEIDYLIVEASNKIHILRGMFFSTT